MDQEFVPVSIRFTRDVHEWLRKKAYETRTPINTIVREAVDETRKAGRAGKKGKSA